VTYEWQFSPVFRYADMLWQGVLGTLMLTGVALLLALPLGLVLALLRLGKVPVLGRMAVIYIEFFRLSAAIVLLYWFYFAFPVLFDITLDPFGAAVLAIGLQAAAFYAEVFRAGLQSVAQGQWEAARAIGMTRAEALRSIILPQALRNTLPVFLARLVDLIKTSALAATIAYPDVVYAAMRVASQTYRPIETFTVLGAGFFIVIFCLSQASRRLEGRLAVGRRI